MICNCTLAGTNACNNCSNNNSIYNNKIQLEIIKEINKNKEAHPVTQYWCSECDALLNKYAKYCHNCGSKINWDNVEDD